MEISDIQELLAARLGFDVETIGSKAVATMVKRAMEHAGFSEPGNYAEVLRRDADVWERFVDQVVIPETWFFRDRAPFELAAELSRAHLRAALGRPLRILSCPCSTGEEPYSLAVAILHAGAPPDSFSVDAVDVSRRVLAFARTAVFTERSFRGDFPQDREPYFHRAGHTGARRLHPSAKARVRFRHGNIVAADFLHQDEPYDLVFCRKLLIYLHSEARLLALTALRRLVADDGVLVLGHAETSFAREHGFKPTGPSGAFAFRKSRGRLLPKAGPADNHKPHSKVSSIQHVHHPQHPQHSHHSHAETATSPVLHQPPAAKPLVTLKVPLEPTREPASESQPGGDSLLATASQLGDAGQLHAALRVCSEYLQSVPDSSEGYFLLGVLHDALGHGELATSSFRKVLYLDPEHQEALLCLALKHEARGDGSSAARLRERARRANKVDERE